MLYVYHIKGVYKNQGRYEKNPGPHCFAYASDLPDFFALNETESKLRDMTNYLKKQQGQVTDHFRRLSLLLVLFIVGDVSVALHGNGFAQICGLGLEDAVYEILIPGSDLS